MKIVHISQADYNGAGLCAYRICVAQRQLGLDSQMVVLNKRRNDRFIHQVGKKRYFLHSSLRKVKRILRLHDDLNECRRLGRKYNAVYTLPVSGIDISEEKVIREADIIHIHWVGGYVDYPTFFTPLRHKAFVFTLHDENPLYGIANIWQQRLPDNELEKKYYDVKHTAVRQLRRMGVVFLSHMTYSRLASHEMIAHALTTIIHNAVNTSRYSISSREAARRRLGISPDATVFALCACNIDEPRKGLDMLSEVLLGLNPEFRILAIGRNRSRPRRHWPNVIEAGPASTPEDMSALLAAANYSCLPSTSEQFAQVPIEAMSCGLPVIAFPCSGTEELITEANGVRCSDFTAEALAEGIRAAMGRAYDPEAIRRDMQTRFSPEVIAGQYLNFYREVLAM